MAQVVQSRPHSRRRFWAIAWRIETVSVLGQINASPREIVDGAGNQKVALAHHPLDQFAADTWRSHVAEAAPTILCRCLFGRLFWGSLLWQFLGQ